MNETFSIFLIILIRYKIKSKSKNNYYHLPHNLNDITNNN